MSIITELNAIRRRNKTAHNLHQQTSYYIPLNKRDEYVMELTPFLTTSFGQRATPTQVACAIDEKRCNIMGIDIYFEKKGQAPEISPDARIDLIARNGNNGEHYATLGIDEEDARELIFGPDTTPTCVLALQAVVEANDRYVELTGRSQDAIVLHPDHARELLELLSKKV